MNLLLSDFEEWLILNSGLNGRKLSRSSVYKYTRAIITISNDMINIGLFDKLFYINSSLQEVKSNVERIKSDISFIRKNQIGHNMYSVALDHFIHFLEEREV